MRAHTSGDIENTDSPRKKPRALTSRQAVGEHTPSLSWAQHYWLADTAPWRHEDHSPKREPGRKGDWGSRDEETTAPDSAPALMDAAE